MLRRRPTCRKFACAVLVLIAEFTALTPDIFPGLQTSESRKAVGGAEGVAGVLWPLCFFMGYVCNQITILLIWFRMYRSRQTKHCC